ncbi:TAXI family TRAP transporter solute-binding subunit [Parapusillimonas sp. SGNA-6]|nr:TAXI family TRAP transporter solute-binding subunit [Parapusillimonas sp. SGNA-6]
MRALFACLILALLSACSFGPDTDALRADVSTRLAQALPGGDVELTGLQRRGSQADTESGHGEERRIVYFDAELKVMRDMDFGAWNAPGIAGLISALGAAPKGIEGIVSGGNKTGDVIRVHGTARYRFDDGQWVAVLPAGYQPPIAPAFVSGQQDDPRTILAALHKVVDAFPRDTSPAHHAAIEEELAAAQATIRARLARISNGYAIAAGAEHGQYLRVARALFGNRDSRTVPLVTRGGDENLRLLRAGKVSLALAQADAALDAFQGTGTFKGEGPHSDLRAIAALYPEPMHVLIRAGDDMTTVADLRGKRVAIGEPGSASRATALRVLAAHGLGPEDITAQQYSIGAELLALQRNETDAVLQVIGTPADSVRDALANIPLRLLSLSDKAIATLTEADGYGYFPFTIAKGTYPGQDEDVKTIATAAMLVTDASLSDNEVEALTRKLFETGRDYSAMGSAQGAQISVATSRSGLSIPMHAAADEAIRSLEAQH